MSEASDPSATSLTGTERRRLLVLPLVCIGIVLVPFFLKLAVYIHHVVDWAVLIGVGGEVLFLFPLYTFFYFKAGKRNPDWSKAFWGLLLIGNIVLVLCIAWFLFLITSFSR